MMWLLIIFVSVSFVYSVPLINETRRILRGQEVGDTRPYMVYLRPASTAIEEVEDNWMCGGVIIDERYVLTSAACIEEVKHFYVVSGTRTWVSPKDNDNACVNNGAKRAIWKCVPKSYIFDGNDVDNIRWMVNDIAVVKVEDDFNFKRRIKGCDFIPQKVPYNNKSKELEKPGSLASIAGWGSTNVFSDIIETPVRSRSAKNSEPLLDTDVVILGKKNCKKRWHERYHEIIDKYMICGKDGLDADVMNAACAANEVNCKELNYSDEDDQEQDEGDTNTRRKSITAPDPEKNEALGALNRRSKPISGGFCENDHGGPLVVGHGKSSVVIGVISASQVRDKGNQCFGPFLYTSVYNNRHLVSCAITKEIGATCRSVLRASRTQMFETVYNWKEHPNGPAAKSEGGSFLRHQKSQKVITNDTEPITPENPLKTTTKHELV